MNGQAGTTARILIVDDDPAIVHVLSYNLTREGYEVAAAASGRAALEKVHAFRPDLVILEVDLAELDGLDVCRELRAEEQTSSLPILMLTVKAQESDQIAGFSVGADDYVTKPFSLKLLLHRIRALLRRAERAGKPAGAGEHLGLLIDRSRHRIAYRGQELNLTLTEFRILECLLRRPGHVFTRQQLMDAAAGERTAVLDRSIDLHIKALRRKLGNARLIETVRGVGYRLQETER